MIRMGDEIEILKNGYLALNRGEVYQVFIKSVGGEAYIVINQVGKVAKKVFLDDIPDGFYKLLGGKQ